MAHSHHAHREHHKSRQRVHHLRKSGGHHFDAGGGAPNLPTTTHGASPDAFNDVGKPSGMKRGGRLNKYARGGAAKDKKHHTQVNIAVVAPHGKDSGPGAAMAPGGAGAPPPRPPIAGGPPPGAMPPGLPPGGPAGGPPGLMAKPPGVMKRGGRIKRARGGSVEKPIPLKKLNLKGGMDSGEGRLHMHKFQGKHRPK